MLVQVASTSVCDSDSAMMVLVRIGAVPGSPNAESDWPGDLSAADGATSSIGSPACTNCITFFRLAIENQSEQGDLHLALKNNGEKCKLWAVVVQFAVLSRHVCPCLSLFLCSY